MQTAAQRLKSNRQDILLEWENKIRQEIPASRQLDQPQLIDTLPAFIDKMVDALNPNSSRMLPTESNTLVQEHGGQRARLSQYDLTKVIQEFQILRDTIYEFLDTEKEPLSTAERRLIQVAVDEAICESVTAYALVQSEIREQFVATLTHDLRSPLGAAEMAADLILYDLDNPDEAELLVERVKNNLKKANRMIQDLLDTIKFNGGGQMDLNVEASDLCQVANQVISQLAEVHGDRFVLEAPTSVSGYWSASALERALENLLSNAVKYGRPETPITVIIKEEFGRAMMIVHNFGPVIPFEDRETIFQTFRRSSVIRNAGKAGWGIGLTLVRSVVESHGGTIVVESDTIRGTEFVIDIPLDSRPYSNQGKVETQV